MGSRTPRCSGGPAARLWRRSTVTQSDAGRLRSGRPWDQITPCTIDVRSTDARWIRREAHTVRFDKTPDASHPCTCTPSRLCGIPVCKSSHLYIYVFELLLLALFRVPAYFLRAVQWESVEKAEALFKEWYPLHHTRMQQHEAPPPNPSQTPWVDLQDEALRRMQQMDYILTSTRRTWE